MPLLLDSQGLSQPFIHPPFRGLMLRLLQTAIQATLLLGGPFFTDLGYG